MKYTALPVSLDRQVTLCGTNVYPAPEIHPDRVMNEHDLCYIYSGEQGVAQGDEQYTLQSGDLIFLRAGDHHYGTIPTAAGTRAMFIHFNRLPGDADCPPQDSSAGEKKSSARFVLPTFMHIGQNNPAAELFNSIITSYWSHDAYRERRCVLLLNLLLDELNAIALADQPEKEEWSVSIINLFQRHPGKMYSLEELADIVGMNVRALSTRFRQVTGQSVHQYQMNYKLEMAYKQLRTGACTVKDAAQSLGFCDAYYFSRQFKKKFGVSPKEIKQRNPAANVNRQLMI